MMKNIKLIIMVAALVFTWALPVFGQCLTLTTTNTPSACVGLANGSINLTVGGGSGSSSYNWTGPNGFTATSHVIITFFVSLSVWFGCVYVGLLENGLR